jgi:hypothetical protein
VLTTNQLRFQVDTVRDIGTGATTSGTISTNLPTTSTYLAPRGWITVGRTSSVIGIALMNLYIESDPETTSIATS